MLGDLGGTVFSFFFLNYKECARSAHTLGLEAHGLRVATIWKWAFSGQLYMYL